MNKIKQICKDRHCNTWISHTEAKNQKGYCLTCYLRKFTWNKNGLKNGCKNG